MQGYLDDIVDGEVYGWAIDEANPDRPVRLTICVDGRPVMETLALYHREDVVEVLKTSGYHGYFADVHQYCWAKDRSIVEARTSDGMLLANPSICYGSTLQRPANSTYVTALFLHIPKTAGTAFREMMEPNFRVSERAYLYPDPNLCPPNLQLWDLPLDQRAKLRFVCGHFPFGVHQALVSDWEYITVLRHPVNRGISHYDHFRRWDPDRLKQGMQTLDIIGAYERRDNVCFDNFMVRCFSGMSEQDCPPGHVDQAVFELALQNLSQFAHVGFQETIDDTCEFLKSRYGLQHSPTLKFVNVGEQLINRSDLDELTKAIEHFETWDLRLYEHALREPQSLH